MKPRYSPALEDEILKAWHRDVCRRTPPLDPGEDLHWRSLWIGFALAKGMDPDRAFRIYLRKAQPFERY